MFFYMDGRKDFIDKNSPGLRSNCEEIQASKTEFFKKSHTFL